MEEVAVDQGKAESDKIQASDCDTLGPPLVAALLRFIRIITAPSDGQEI